MVAPHSTTKVAGAGACADPLAGLKAEARRAALARRAGCDPALGTALAERVLAEAPPPAGAVVAGFWPMGQEIDIRPLLQALEARGHPLVLPVTPRRGQPLAFRRWRHGEALAPGPMGTRQPASGEILAPDWLLVPLLAFDRAGRRLGYGAAITTGPWRGCRRPDALGCGFAAQEMDAVPAGPRDVRLRCVATERGVIVCGT